MGGRIKVHGDCVEPKKGGGVIQVHGRWSAMLNLGAQARHSEQISLGVGFGNRNDLLGLSGKVAGHGRERGRLGR